MPSLKHARIQKQLVRQLENFLLDRYEVLAEISLSISDGKMIPDVAVFVAGTLPNSAGPDFTAVSVVPRTAIEILSPTQVIAELLEKAGRYFAAGVQSYWLVVPELRAVAVYSAPMKYKYFYNGDTLRDPVTGAEIVVSQLFD
ncbi:Uma2 family endonuclease [Hymenobacter sp. BT662]|uniref:Uma2 family endonuclease n=2 Tax=Hymenobacter ruricola TaxID=2791023 RepID=A0ABS0HZU3_9BACT|nr:Uma2 family endonuclease [Hymenobacter ruricola]